MNVRLRIIIGIVTISLAPHGLGAETLRIGSTHNQPVDEIRRFLPLASYLEKRLKADGITQVQVVVSGTLREAAKHLREGTLDLYIDSPFPSLALSQLSGSKFLARRWKKGVAEYHTVIFARKDGGVSRLDDLKQKILGFETNYSSSGYFFPKMVLLQQGFKLVPLANPADPVERGKIGYVFTGDDENTLLWVVRGKVSVGALDDQAYLRDGRDELDKLQVVYRSFSIPRQIVSHRASLAPRLVARIKETLVKMDQSQEGNGALRGFEKTTKFDEIPAAAMTPLREGWKFIEAEALK